MAGRTRSQAAALYGRKGSQQAYTAPPGTSRHGPRATHVHTQYPCIYCPAWAPHQPPGATRSPCAHSPATAAATCTGSEGIYSSTPLRLRGRSRHGLRLGRRLVQQPTSSSCSWVSDWTVAVAKGRAALAPSTPPCFTPDEPPACQKPPPPLARQQPPVASLSCGNRAVGGPKPGHSPQARPPTRHPGACAADQHHAQKGRQPPGPCPRAFHQHTGRGW